MDAHYDPAPISHGSLEAGSNPIPDLLGRKDHFSPRWVLYWWEMNISKESSITYKDRE